MLGVLGGMGPAAGAYFAYRLALLTHADCDQQHVPVLLMNDPRIPDRSQARVGCGPDPFPYMRAGLQFLEASGCSCAVMPCNTAHYWHAALQASVRIPLLSIVDSAVVRLKKSVAPGASVAVMGTPATVRSDLYRGPLAAAGYAVLSLSEADEQQLCVKPIQAVKANRITAGAEAIGEAIDILRRRGADAVLLACTELPVAVAASRKSDFGVTLVDSIDELAYSALDHLGVGSTPSCARANS